MLCLNFSTFFPNIFRLTESIQHCSFKHWDEFSNLFFSTPLICPHGFLFMWHCNFDFFTCAVRRPWVFWNVWLWLKCIILHVVFADHVSNYSDDLDTDDLASFLNNWEDPASYAGLRSPSRQSSQEKLSLSPDSPVASSSDYSSEAPPAARPPMDIEADISVGEEMTWTQMLRVDARHRSAAFLILALLGLMGHVVPFPETLERLARLREQSQRSPSPPPATQRRRQNQRKAREKRVTVFDVY